MRNFIAAVNGSEDSRNDGQKKRGGLRRIPWRSPFEKMPPPSAANTCPLIVTRFTRLSRTRRQRLCAARHFELPSEDGQRLCADSQSSSTRDTVLRRAACELV
jgi:hypothetical protein